MCDIIDLTVHRSQLERTAKRCRERNIVIPTFAQMKDPSLIPKKITGKLRDIGLWDIHPGNLFRITWKNDPVPRGGGFGGVNHLWIPREIAGIPYLLMYVSFAGPMTVTTAPASFMR